MKRVEVQWLDSVGNGDWEQKDEALSSAEESMIHWTIGYVLNETEEYILLIGSKNNNESVVQGTMQIPKACVLNVKELVYPNA